MAILVLCLIIYLRVVRKSFVACGSFAGVAKEIVTTKLSKCLHYKPEHFSGLGLFRKMSIVVIMGFSVSFIVRL